MMELTYTMIAIADHRRSDGQLIVQVTNWDVVLRE